MSTLLLGIGDYGATGVQGDIVKTLALGSCVALVFLDPVSKTIGMAHVALPDSKTNLEKKREKPGYFADSAVPALMEAMKTAGSQGIIRKMYIKFIGGANVLNSSSSFDIGKRNVLALKKILWQQGTGPVAEDVGGHFSRTVVVDVNSGTIKITCPGKGEWEL